MADLIRVNLNGTMPSGEVWSINPIFSFSAPLALSTDELRDTAEAINGVTIPTNLLVMIPNSMAWTSTRVEARKASGELEGVGEHIRPIPITGLGMNQHPPQTSQVLSLRTVDSSARGKGRLYFPAISQSIDRPTLRFTATATSDFVEAANAYLASLRTAIRGEGGMTTAVLAVWSRANASTKVVVSVRAGDVPDVQRRRRDTFVESYTSAVVPSP